jgi:hypothetical protein
MAHRKSIGVFSILPCSLALAAAYIACPAGCTRSPASYHPATASRARQDDPPKHDAQAPLTSSQSADASWELASPEGRRLLMAGSKSDATSRTNSRSGAFEPWKLSFDSDSPHSNPPHSDGSGQNLYYNSRVNEYISADSTDRRYDPLNRQLHFSGGTSATRPATRPASRRGDPSR